MGSILFINPNTTQSMTEKIRLAAIAVASPGMHIEARNPRGGPASIQGRADGEAALPGLFEEIDKAGEFDVIVIACFDDTGIEEARRRAKVPVLGIGEAAFHLAMLAAPTFSVITTLAVSVPIIEDNLDRYGFRSRCRRVRASEVAVLDLEKPGSTARGKVSAEIERAIGEDDCGAIVLGCAGMADLADDLSGRHDIPVIDGVAAATKLAELQVLFGFGQRWS